MTSLPGRGGRKNCSNSNHCDSSCASYPHSQQIYTLSDSTAATPSYCDFASLRFNLWPYSENLEKAVTVDLKQTTHTEGGDKVWDSVDPRFPPGLPFPVPKFLEFKALRNSGKLFSTRVPQKGLQGVFVNADEHKQTRTNADKCRFSGPLKMDPTRR